jgi:hypothetical protein
MVAIAERFSIYGMSQSRFNHPLLLSDDGLCQGRLSSGFDQILRFGNSQMIFYPLVQLHCPVRLPECSNVNRWARLNVHMRPKTWLNGILAAKIQVVVYNLVGTYYEVNT